MTATDLEARCAVALAARDAAVSLRDLAEALDVPADVLAGDRGKARLAARRARCVRVLEHLAAAIYEPKHAAQWGHVRQMARNVAGEWPALSHQCRESAAEWDRFADEVDP